MLSSLFHKSRVRFVDELDMEDYHWKICRLTTHVDIISIGLSKYFLNPVETERINLTNACLKSLIVNELGETEIEKYSSEELNKRLKSEKSLYIQTYDRIFSEVMDFDNLYHSTLLDEKNYLRMLAKLKLNDYPREVIFQVVKLLASY